MRWLRISSLLRSVLRVCWFELGTTNYLRYAIADYRNRQRLHQLMDNLPLTGLPPPRVSPLPLEEVDCRERLSGLLKHFYRRVA